MIAIFGSIFIQKIEDLVRKHFDSIVISIQVVNEVYNVLTKKILINKALAREIVYKFGEYFKVISIDFSLTQRAIEINMRYNYSFWDSLIIASALVSGCDTLYTEDMHHGQVIEGKLKIVNPFLKERLK